jgi:repressor LexA
MNTGNTIKKLRKSRNMTQAELGKQLGVAATTVSSWERGVAYPLMTVAKTMATFFGVPVSTIAGDENSEASAPLPIHSYPFIPADISAGAPERVDAITPDQLEQVAIPDAVMGKWAGHSDIMLMRANGESMNRVIPNGSLIGVRKIAETSELNDGDIVVFDCDGDYAVKRFFNDRAHSAYVFQPDSDRTDFFPVVYNYDDDELVDIVGKVVMYVVELS